MIQQELRGSDLPEQAVETASEGGGGSKANAQYSSARARAAQAAASAVAPSSQLWLGFKDPRIVRVSRTLGGKDRHSKVTTVRGLRDRRVRLSVQTAIQLYDLQDRLGLSQPSKVVDWLLDAAQHEIDKLPPLHFPPHFPHVGNSSGIWGAVPHGHVVGRNSSLGTTLSKEEDRSRDDDDGKEGLDRGRGVDCLNGTAVSYQHFTADDLPNRPASTVVAAVQLTPGSYAQQQAVPSNGRSCLYYNNRLAASPPPSQLSLLPVLGGTQTSSAQAALLFCTVPGAIAMPYTTSASTHGPKLLDHFHSSACTTTATGTSTIAAPQSYFPSTNSDSFAAAAVAAAPNSIGRLLS